MDWLDAIIQATNVERRCADPTVQVSGNVRIIGMNHRAGDVLELQPAAANRVLQSLCQQLRRIEARIDCVLVFELWYLVVVLGCCYKVKD